MFFPERIINILDKDKVLEVGPGAGPHPRSDVLLELNYDSKEEEQSQFGHTGNLISNKQIIYYDGHKFPFKDNEFDYAICSHVLEHVNDVEFFLSELQRVAVKGYLEFPTVYYDYLFNFDVHKNFLFWDGAVIHWGKKKEYELDKFMPIQDLFRVALEKQTISVVNELREFVVQGFEWTGKLQFQHERALNLLCFKEYLLEDKTYKPNNNRLNVSFRQKIKIKLKLMIDAYL
jgi:hypothetical protein